LTGLSGDRQRRPTNSCINVDTTMTKKVPNLNEGSIERTKARTISFELLYGLVILRDARRRLVSIRVTNNPTAEWIAGQVIDAFPRDEAPRHLLRDRDGAFGPGSISRQSTSGDTSFRRIVSTARRHPRSMDWGTRCPRNAGIRPGLKRYSPEFFCL